LSGKKSQTAIHGAVTKTMTKSNALAQYLPISVIV